MFRRINRVNDEPLEKSSCYCGYHVYKDIWALKIHEEFVCHQESGNEHDRFAITIFTGGENILGHLTLTDGVRVAPILLGSAWNWRSSKFEAIITVEGQRIFEINRNTRFRCLVNI